MAGPKASAQYEAVRSKVAAGMSVGDAIRSVATENETSSGTVHTNYYRVAREQGTTAKRRARAGRNLPVSDAPSQDLVRRAMDALAELAARNEQLEKDSARLKRIERSLSDTP